MSQHSMFEVHVTQHPQDAVVVTGLSKVEARALAEAEHGVIVERLLSLDQVDAIDALAETP
jgi:hypothetical protein